VLGDDFEKKASTPLVQEIPFIDLVHEEEKEPLQPRMFFFLFFPCFSHING